jgi:hypothetical protein
MRLYSHGINPDYVSGKSDVLCRDGFTEEMVRVNIQNALKQAAAEAQHAPAGADVTLEGQK